MHHNGVLKMFRRKPLLLALIPIAIFTQCAFASLICILPVYLAEEGGAPKEFAGFVISGFALVETALKAFSGALGDKLGRLKVIISGLLIAMCVTAAMIIFGTMKLWMPFILAHPIAGIGAAMIWTSLTALFLDIAPQESRATALGVDNLCYLTGIVIGAASSFGLRYHFGSSTAVFATALICLTCALIIASCIEKRIKSQVRSTITTPIGLGVAMLRRLMQLCQNKLAILLALILGLIQFAIAIQIPVLPIYAHSALKLTDAQISISIFAIAITLSLFALPLSRIGDLFPRLYVIRLALSIGVLAFAIAPRLKSMSLIAPLGTVSGAGWVMGLPAILATVDDVSSLNGRGMSIGFATTAQGIGFILGPSFGSLAMSRISMTAPFTLSCASLLIALVLTFPLGKFLSQSKMALHGNSRTG